LGGSTEDCGLAAALGLLFRDLEDGYFDEFQRKFVSPGSGFPAVDEAVITLKTTNQINTQRTNKSQLTCLEPHRKFLKSLNTKGSVSTTELASRFAGRKFAANPGFYRADFFKARGIFSVRRRAPI
jgi:hypothetical protein